VSTQPQVADPEITSPPPWRWYGVVASFILLAGLYVAFVLHYSINQLSTDDWTVVPLVQSALHSHLSWSALWAQHNENRMLVPNLVFVAVGVTTHENAQAVMVLSAAIFIGTFVVFMVLLRSYLGRPLTALTVLPAGLIWFSLVDWQNALWAFQLAWYLILAFFVGMLYLLLIAPPRPVFVVLGGVLAVAASYSSFQGLLLWPIGLVCLLWVRNDARVIWLWLSGAVVTTAIYFVGYLAAPPSPDGMFPKTLFGLNVASVSPGYALDHPILTVQVILATVGNAIPINSDPKTPWGSEVIGVLVVVAAAYVVVRCVRQRGERTTVLPLALIGFGLLFDIGAEIGRVKLGVSEAAFVSRYSMGGLLLLLAVLTYGLRSVSGRRAVQIGVVTLLAIVAVQVVSSARYGVSQSVANKQTLETGARLVVNNDRVPPKQRECYDFSGLISYHLPLLSANFVRSVHADHLSVFAYRPYRVYRSEGLPIIRECQ
jgi:hypothetical protein